MVLRGVAFALGCCVGVSAWASGNARQGLPERATVRRVVDGDTAELQDGRLVRYIGIDTPEARRKDARGAWVADPQPLSREATEFNRWLVEGRRVRFEYDAQTHDRYRRLLAYLYVESGGREVMVNAELLRAGLAQLLTIPPNVKYVERFKASVEEARRRRRGLWND